MTSNPQLLPRVVALFAIFGSLPFPALAGAPPRNWAAHPAVLETGATGDIYALGDVHGDDGKMAGLLAAAGLIADKESKTADVKWTGGKAVLVCTGDCIDKGPHSLDVLLRLRALQPQALTAGGRVILTMGNHEAEFLAAGGRGKKAAEFAKELKDAGLSAEDVAAGIDAAGVGAFLRGLPIAAKVDDWFFCHSGNTHGLALDRLREKLVKGIDANGFADVILSHPDSLLEARMHPTPWWEQFGGNEGTLRAGIEALGCKHLVVGHQPGEVDFADGTHRPRNTMFTKFDGLVFMTDTGMSRGVDDAPAAMLRIHRDSDHVEGISASAIYADGTNRLLWNHE